MGQGCGKVEISGRNGYIWPLCIRRTQMWTRTLCSVDSVGTCDDWYTNGHFCCFGCLLTVVDCFWRLVHCWYSLGRHVMTKMQKWPLVYQSPHVYQDCTNGVPQCTNRQKQSKYSQNSNNFATTFGYVWCPCALPTGMQNLIAIRSPIFEKTELGQREKQRNSKLNITRPPLTWERY